MHLIKESVIVICLASGLLTVLAAASQAAETPGPAFTRGTVKECTPVEIHCEGNTLVTDGDVLPADTIPESCLSLLVSTRTLEFATRNPREFVPPVRNRKPVVTHPVLDRKDVP